MEEKRAWGKGNLIRSIVILAIVAFLALLPAWGGDYIVNIFLLIMLYMSLGHMWNLLAGYSGLVSLGQQSFVGLGGYALAMISQVYKLPLALGFLVAGVVSVLFALIISVPIFKMKNVYFTIGTWIVSECLRVFFSTWKFVNYSTGYNISATYRLAPAVIYYVALGVGLCTTAVVWLILRSRFGLGLMAMRDNEPAAEIRGVQLYRTKLMCFLISAFLTGITGAALYLNIAYIKPEAAFSIDWTISMVFVVIIGGIGTMEGPIVGAIIFVLLRQYLYSFPGFSMLILGVVAIVLMILAPKGIMGYLNGRLGWDLLSVRRHIRPVINKQHF